MASIVFNERVGKWRAFINRKGHPRVSKVFVRKSDAEAWARHHEAKIDRGVSYEWKLLRQTIIADLIGRYLDEVAPTKKGWRWERTRCVALQRYPWASLQLHLDPAPHLTAWTQERLSGSDGVKGVSAATVHRDLNLLSSIYVTAIKRWHMDLPHGNPIKRVVRPKIVGGEREMVWTDEDLRLFLEHLKFDETKVPTAVSSYLGWVVLVARYTGLRLSNVVGMETKDIDLLGRVIHFGPEAVKNGRKYDCPLSQRACSVLSKLLELRPGEDRPFVSTATSIGTLVRQQLKLAACQHPRFALLRIHDLRHTFTTEAAGKVGDAMTLMKITGRRTMRSLARYYHPSVEELGKLLD